MRVGGTESGGCLASPSVFDFRKKENIAEVPALGLCDVFPRKF
jgi:hypothetical protein